jgi:heme/copper-type cytochrome/quinol oxidase subunit 2
MAVIVVVVVVVVVIMMLESRHTEGELGQTREYSARRKVTSMSWRPWR